MRARRAGGGGEAMEREEEVDKVKEVQEGEWWRRRKRREREKKEEEARARERERESRVGWAFKVKILHAGFSFFRFSPLIVRLLSSPLSLPPSSCSTCFSFVSFGPHFCGRL